MSTKSIIPQTHAQTSTTGSKKNRVNSLAEQLARKYQLAPDDDLRRRSAIRIQLMTRLVAEIQTLRQQIPSPSPDTAPRLEQLSATLAELLHQHAQQSAAYIASSKCEYLRALCWDTAGNLQSSKNFWQKIQQKANTYQHEKDKRLLYKRASVVFAGEQPAPPPPASTTTETVSHIALSLNIPHDLAPDHARQYVTTHLLRSEGNPQYHELLLAGAGVLKGTCSL